MWPLLGSVTVSALYFTCLKERTWIGFANRLHISPVCQIHLYEDLKEKNCKLTCYFATLLTVCDIHDIVYMCIAVKPYSRTYLF